VLLVHGFASDYQLNWVGTRWQETLVGANYRVIGLDCRGHGQSDKPHDPAAYAIDVLAADVRRLLDELQIASVRYVGYSMGARIGLQSVLDFPDRLHRAVLGGLGAFGRVEDAEAIARIAPNAPKLAAQIPTARLVVIPGRDHLSTVPARPFKEAALEFLAQN
jgi:pimeloyl-ACP methyl ester carboxylesterase